MNLEAVGGNRCHHRGGGPRIAGVDLHPRLDGSGEIDYPHNGNRKCRPRCVAPPRN